MLLKYAASSNSTQPDIADGHRMEADDGGATEPHLSATDGGVIDEDEGAIAINGEGDGGDDGLLRNERAVRSMSAMMTSRLHAWLKKVEPRGG